jgi:ribonuclease HI
MRGELSSIDAAVADAPGDEELTILTDSFQKLAGMKWQDIREWLNGHPEKAFLESLVQRIIKRARAQVFTHIIKVPAHREHELNEAADAAASQAAEEADADTAALSHVDSAQYDSTCRAG